MTYMNLASNKTLRIAVPKISIYFLSSTLY